MHKFEHEISVSNQTNVYTCISFFYDFLGFERFHVESQFANGTRNTSIYKTEDSQSY